MTGRRPTADDARARATVRLPDGVLATLLFVAGARGHRARVLVGGRHRTVERDELVVVEDVTA